MGSKPECKKPRMVMLSGMFYVVDFQQKRFQQVLDPYDYVSFDSLEGRQLCSKFGLTSISNAKLPSFPIRQQMRSAWRRARSSSGRYEL